MSGDQHLAFVMGIIQARIISEKEDKYIVSKWLQTIPFTMEKPGIYHLNQMIEVNITSNETNWHCVPPAKMHWGEHFIFRWCIFTKNASSEYNHEEISDKPKIRDILQGNWAVLSKTTKVIKRQVKTKELV